jgi:hypothetical protein
MHAPRKRTWQEKILASQWFLVALLLHVVAFLFLASWVLLPPHKEEVTGTFEGPIFTEPKDPIEITLPPHEPKEDTELVTPPNPITQPTTKSLYDIFLKDPSRSDVPSIPWPKENEFSKNKIVPERIPVPPSPNEGQERIQIIQERTREKWHLHGTRSTLKAEFACYVAKYAQGDWSTNLTLQNGKIIAGGLPNLLHFIQQESRDRIRPRLDAEPVNLGSEVLLETMPPFVFFNGHKDFRLTEAEVDNLRKYLSMGGAVWADNGLAGPGSRFDVAFRREMKRVLNNKDMNFEMLPEDHDIFQQANLKAIPAGMNYAKHPVEVIRLGSDIAVIYSVNSYAHLWQLRLKPESQEPDLKAGPNKPWVTPTVLEMWNQRDTYYRNFTPESVHLSQRLGQGILLHLLTRFEQRME